MSLPAHAVSTYERLREQVVSGESRPEGLAAIVYHGMLRGLAVILSETPAAVTPLSPASELEAVPVDRELVHIMVNMVLQSQSQVMHVY
jgi:hypothetical protein